MDFPPLIGVEMDMRPPANRPALPYMLSTLAAQCTRFVLATFGQHSTLLAMLHVLPFFFAIALAAVVLGLSLVCMC